MANVKFLQVQLKETYTNLETKDSLALYWIEETQELYKGDKLFGTGKEATALAAGLLSAEDKAKLDALADTYSKSEINALLAGLGKTEAEGKVETVEDLANIENPEVGDVYDVAGEDSQYIYDGENWVLYEGTASSSDGGITSLSPVDGTITVEDVAGGGKAIGVKISPDAGNILEAVDGGLYVPETKVSVPEYAIEKQETAEDGYVASYKLKMTVDGEESYVGDTINIAKDMVLQSASLETVTIADVPYEGAEIGDPYIKMVFNDPEASALYIPVKGLVDTYTAGDGIEIVDNAIKVRLAENAHGLTVVDGALTINLATKDSDGAMSKEDKLVIDSLPSVYKTKDYEIVGKPAGTLVNYRDDEVRIMCPADTEWKFQTSGAGADENSYYIGFKAYAPEGAVSFKEDLAELIADDTMYYFEDNDFAGEDLFGRKYSVVWLPVAKFDGSAWTYHGVKSTSKKYIGWFYTVEWYDADGVMIGTDTIRVNLSNEDCHNNNKPYYIGEFATSAEVEALAEQVGELESAYTWGTL